MISGWMGRPLTQWLAWFLMWLALAPVAAAAQKPKDIPLRAMTYNIRLDLASDGKNAWPNRKDYVAALIRHEAPDILGMQEVLLRQKQDLEAALPEYHSVGVGRDDGRESGEFSPLFFLASRFEPIASGTIWLSETPDRPSKSWDAAFPRIATWALLRDRRDHVIIRVVNTHFDHVGVIARYQSAWILSRWLQEGTWAGLPTVLMGDLNSEPDMAPFRLLADTANSGLRDARANSRTAPYGPPGTFNAFKIDRDAPAPIDHVFLSSTFTIDRYSVITQQWGGRVPSDHYPVVVDLHYRTQ